MTPDDDVDAVAAVAAALAAGDRVAADTAVAKLERELKPRPSRSAVPPRIAFSVFTRDQWHCRYCGQRVVLSAALRLISGQYPRQFPYHPHGKWDSTHPVYNTSLASIDHLNPYSVDGNNNALTNLITACWVCNIRKSNLTLEQLGWTLIPVEPSDWKGLADLMKPIWEALGHPELSSPDKAWLGLLETLSAS